LLHHRRGQRGDHRCVGRSVELGLHLHRVSVVDGEPADEDQRWSHQRVHQGDVAATIAEESASLLTAPVRRVAAPNTPVPFSPPMENFYVPSVERIAKAIRETLAY